MSREVDRNPATKAPDISAFDGHEIIISEEGPDSSDSSTRCPRSSHLLQGGVVDRDRSQQWETSLASITHGPGLESKAQEMQQDDQESAQDPADAADQYHQPAVTDIQASKLVGQKKNH